MYHGHRQAVWGRRFFPNHRTVSAWSKDIAST
jgi:hypothetical protein